MIPYLKHCSVLNKDFVECVKDAEKKEDMTMLKNMALKRKCEETEEVKELEKVLGIINAKKKLLD